MVNYLGKEYETWKVLARSNNPQLAYDTFMTRLKKFGKDDEGIRKALAAGRYANPSLGRKGNWGKFKMAKWGRPE